MKFPLAALRLATEVQLGTGQMVKGVVRKDATVLEYDADMRVVVVRLRGSPREFLIPVDNVVAMERHLEAPKQSQRA